MEPFLSIVTDINVVESKDSEASITKGINNRKRSMVGFAEISWVCWILVVGCLAPLCITVDRINAQTCIVIRRTPSTIYVGADSKTVTYPDPRKGTYYVGSKCKIRQEGKTFFAIAAHLSFDGDAIARESIRRGRTLGEKSMMFETLVKEKLIAMLEETRTDYPLVYKNTFVGKSALQIVFCGFENRIPACLTRDYMAINTMIEPIRLSTETSEIPGNLSPFRSFTTLLGATEKIEPLIGNGEFWKGKTPIDGIRVLIDIETKAEGSIVGGPVDILRITASQAEWIQKKKECPDIQAPLKNLSKKPKTAN